jgi:hypothetical protein
MPCYDARDNRPEPEYIYKPGTEPSILKALQAKHDRLEAGLCAIFNALMKRDLANEILAEASRHGQIDLMNLWHEHHEVDRVRLAKELHRFSKDEQQILRDLLSE